MPLIYKKNKDVHRGVFLNSGGERLFFYLFFAEKRACIKGLTVEKQEALKPKGEVKAC